uniref:PiggyBac transposable element-derived protein domain-containing protein n=2 Tax=Arion vulgaris TaxID=1028688 RepID=A0A0B7BFW1_9EUPU
MVVYLIAPLLGKGHHVYCDNWYTSLRLFLYLLEKQTLACGTIRVGRGIPEQLQLVQLDKGASSVVTEKL